MAAAAVSYAMTTTASARCIGWCSKIRITAYRGPYPQLLLQLVYCIINEIMQGYLGMRMKMKEKLKQL